MTKHARPGIFWLMDLDLHLRVDLDWPDERREAIMEWILDYHVPNESAKEAVARFNKSKIGKTFAVEA